MTKNVDLSSIELCAGVGMLGEGFAAALEFLGIGHRTVCYVEREAAAAAQLATLMEAGALAPAPIWTDLLTFPSRRMRGKVAGVIAGFPCQDISIAGRRAGLDGKRSGLFFNILDIADACGAWFLALENVSAIATATATVVAEAEGELFERAAARVLGELADRGWHTEWITFPASDVGANHGRARWFCFAWRMADTQGDDGPWGLRLDAEAATGPESGPARRDNSLGNPNGQREQQPRQQDGAQPRERPRAGTGGTGGTVGTAGGPEFSGCDGLADASSSGREGSEQRGARDDERHGPDAHGPAGELRGPLPLFAPGPSDPIWRDILSAGRIGAWQRAVTDDEAGASPWAPATKPGVRVLADGVALVVDESRPHQLRQVGNGVVPLQAAVAFVVLIRRARGLI